MYLKSLFSTLFLAIFTLSFGANIVSTECASDAGFPLSVEGTDTRIYTDALETELIGIAANLLSSDIEKVTGISHDVVHNIADQPEYVVIIGTTDSSSLIKQLVEAGKMDIQAIENKWESFTIQTIDAPFEGTKKALVIAGSDRRGAAYGVFELSKSIGVSPWYWWADATPTKKESIYVCPINFASKEPTVKYRGIFINDEDWGLQEWSQYTFDPVKDIGPVTYEKVFELLLRLKANYIWPAMHPSTKPFNYYPENKIVADRYGIIMGSSHHEPLLYNTEEWPYSASEWNPFSYMDKIMRELEKRVASNGKYENVYTVGIRGVGDGSVAGGSSLNDKTAKLEEVVDRQRALLSKYVNADASQVPQVFWPYKEVLDQYNNNMKLPDDITLGWVDDNHGYIRQVSNPTEQKRAGGSGVYYHLSYWGSPADYLWIASTPPALIATEMKKAADFGGDKIWIFNVGDIKPSEMLMNFSLDLAYDYTQWDATNVHDYLQEWAAYTFGDQYADEIVAAYSVYFQLAQSAKPEHINRVSFPDSEIDYRLKAYSEISDKVETLHSQMPEDLKDAFFEMVYYPIKGADYMNQKFLYAYKSFRSAVQNDPKALEYSQAAKSAHRRIQEITAYYNTRIKNGKWNRIISADIRSQNVYDMPAVATQADLDKEYAEIADISLANGVYVFPMRYTKGVVVGNKSGVQTTTTGGKAEYTFELDKSVLADIYFLVKTPTDNEDSWHINVNGTQFVQNNYVTGENFEWINVRSERLKAGTNKIVINQREPNAQISAIKIAEPGLLQYSSNFIPQPDTVVPAWKFDSMHNASGFTWTEIEGLSSSKKAMINLPYTNASVSSAQQAPYMEKTISLTNTDFLLEVRCLPTRRLYSGRDLRIAVSINNETPQVYSIQQPYPSTEWERNVLRGYTKISQNYTVTNAEVNVKLYALDPGVIFDKVLFYYDDKSNTNTASDNIRNKDEAFSVYPNPCGETITCNFSFEQDRKTEILLMDLTGKVLKKVGINGKKDSPHYSLSTSGIPHGNFLVSILDDHGIQHTQLIVKH